MGSKHKDKKMKQHHENPEPQQKNHKDDVNIVENEIPKINNEKEETLEVKIEMVHPSSDKKPPVVCYFPTDFKPTTENSKFTLYQHETKKNRYQMVVEPNGHDVKFVGTNYSGEGAAPQICEYGLGVFDKDTKTLRIFPILGNKIFRMDPCFDEVTQDETQQILKDDVNNEDRKQKSRLLDSKQKSRLLDEMYATKKTNTKNKKRDSLLLKEDPRSKQDLEKALEHVTFKTDSG